MIPRLASECAKYLRRNMDSSVVLGVLKYAQQYENIELPLQCWNVIDQETEEVLKSSDFVTMENCFFGRTTAVDKDTLNVKEVELFKAVNCWAEKECKRQNLRAEGPVKRQILGEKVIKNIRFPVMREDEFINVVTKTDMLTEDETSDMRKYYNSSLSSTGFLKTERLGSPLIYDVAFLKVLKVVVATGVILKANLMLWT